MNDKFTSAHQEDAEFVEKLNALSEQTNPDPRFANELERQLKAAHKPRTIWWIPQTNSILPSLGWVVLVVAAGFLLNWSIRNLIPTHQPASGGTPEGYICPVTQPNTFFPPGETTGPENAIGNDQVIVEYWKNGTDSLLTENPADNSFRWEVWWWRNVTGALDIEGRRIDAESESLHVEFADSTGDTGPQKTILIFPSPGCWEVTGRAGDASLTFVLEVASRQTIPTPEAVIETNTTPPPHSGGYDWRNTKLYLSVPLPQTPSNAKLFTVKNEQPVSIETAKAMAAQFGIQGVVYETPSPLSGNLGYLVTDGKQRLYIQSDINFSYYADYGTYHFMSGGKNITDEQAAAVIEAFMQSHGLNFPYRIENPHTSPGMYYVLPLTQDGLRIQFDYNMPSRIEITIDENGQVILLASYRIEFDTLDGEYGIISAEEAFQQVLDQSDTIQNGVLEIMRSGGGTSDPGFWSRTHPDNETITIYGQPLIYPAAEAGRAPFISIGQFTATGNVAGIENVEYTTYIEATGQFIDENGIRKFNVDTWQVTTAPEAYLSGSLRREGGQIILTADDGSGEYVIEDAPADLPLNTTIPDDYLAVHGFMAGGELVWDSIQFYPSGSAGGGGGGGGNGFYQLNLSGTPVPFPSPTTTPEIGQGQGNYIVQAGDTLNSIAASFGVTIEALMEANGIDDPGMIYIDQRLIIPGMEPVQTVTVGQRLEGMRGIFQVNIYRQSDGSERVEYGFFDLNANNPAYYLLEGADLQNLQSYHNLPLDIWGEVSAFDQFGKPIVRVERHEIPFPDLQFKIMQGKQKQAQVDGEPALLITSSDGTTYIQLTPIGTLADLHSLMGSEGDEVIMETLAIPGESVGGYPGLRVFSSAMAVNPKDGQSAEMTITANQPSIMEEAPSNPDAYVPPAATIEVVELVYYVPDPAYSNSNPNSGSVQYIQPAWRFYGHYSNGDEFEFLVQALKKEFLLPELAPYRSPG